MRRWIAGAALVAATAGPAHAQSRSVRGVITAAHSPLPIADATVLTDRGGAAVSDVDGYFTVALTADDRELTVLATGYAPRTVRIGTAEILRIELAPASGAEIIEVSGKEPEQTEPLSYQLTVDEIRGIPGAGNDILRAATVLPGVARIPFSFGGLVLRGSSPRDSAVYLDGIEVPIAFHFGGVTSFYPSGMLADLTLTAGNYDASYGRAQGGIVTLATREPRSDRWRMGGSIGLFDSSVNAEGPLWGGGILVGVRRSYFDTIADPFVAEDVPLPSYLDFQIRTTFGDPRRRGRITPMLFGSLDRVSSNEIAVTSAFVRAAAPYLRNWGETTLRIVPWVGLNRLSLTDNENVEFGEPEERFVRPFYPGGVRGELIRDTSWGHLRGGAELTSGYLARTQVGISLEDEDTDVDGESTLAWSDFAVWGEVRYRLAGERMAIKPGLRIERYGLSGETTIDPRLNIHQQLTPSLTLRQAIGRYSQPPTPGDVDPRGGNRALDGSHADQISLGLDALLPEDVTASLTAYYADVRELGVRVRAPMEFEQPEPNTGGLGPTFELLLEEQLGFATYRAGIGRGTNLGVELQVKRNVRGVFTLLSYTLARAERVDDPRTDVGRRPFELDQRHNLQVVIAKQFPRWRFGARLQLVSGNPYSPVRYVDGEPVEEAFAGRLPPFISLDLRADRRWHKCWGDLVLFFDVQNVTNRRNVEGRDATTEGETAILGLPIIPFVGVEFLPLI